jgi:hypothetical protein
MSDEPDSNVTGCLIALGLFLLAALIAAAVLILAYG